MKDANSEMIDLKHHISKKITTFKGIDSLLEDIFKKKVVERDKKNSNIEKEILNEVVGNLKGLNIEKRLDNIYGKNFKNSMEGYKREYLKTRVRMLSFIETALFEVFILKVERKIKKNQKIARELKELYKEYFKIRNIERLDMLYFGDILSNDKEIKTLDNWLLEAFNVYINKMKNEELEHIVGSVQKKLENLDLFKDIQSNWKSERIKMYSSLEELYLNKLNTIESQTSNYLKKYLDIYRDINLQKDRELKSIKSGIKVIELKLKCQNKINHETKNEEIELSYLEEEIDRIEKLTINQNGEKNLSVILNKKKIEVANSNNKILLELDNIIFSYESIKLGINEINSYRNFLNKYMENLKDLDIVDFILEYRGEKLQNYLNYKGHSIKSAWDFPQLLLEKNKYNELVKEYKSQVKSLNDIYENGNNLIQNKIKNIQKEITEELTNYKSTISKDIVRVKKNTKSVSNLKLDSIVALKNKVEESKGHILKVMHKSEISKLDEIIDQIDMYQEDKKLLDRYRSLLESNEIAKGKILDSIEKIKRDYHSSKGIKLIFLNFENYKTILNENRIENAIIKFKNHPMVKVEGKDIIDDRKAGINILNELKSKQINELKKEIKQLFNYNYLEAIEKEAMIRKEMKKYDIYKEGHSIDELNSVKNFLDDIKVLKNEKKDLDSEKKKFLNKINPFFLLKQKKHENNIFTYKR